MKALFDWLGNMDEPVFVIYLAVVCVLACCGFVSWAAVEIAKILANWED